MYGLSSGIKTSGRFREVAVGGGSPVWPRNECTFPFPKKYTSYIFIDKYRDTSPL